MTPEHAFELAKQASDIELNYVPAFAEFLQRFAELVRNEALEEAAIACQSWGNPSSFTYLGSACRAAASRITGMKS